MSLDFGAKVANLAAFQDTPNNFDLVKGTIISRVIYYYYGYLGSDNYNMVYCYPWS
ncbi:MAG: hypothetical protein AB8V06_05860 [Francisella endosymbiont of Hyalomma asiaticum]